jgi:hypothetical protein
VRRRPASIPATSPEDGRALKTLELEYEDICRERDRLRTARGDFSRQLGPLPVAAGISTGTIAVFAHHLRHSEWIWVALALLVVLVVVSILYSSMPAYRHIRALKERQIGRPDGLPPADWYRRMIEIERAIYGAPVERNRLGLPRRQPTDLQDAFDRERTGLYAVQLLFVLLVIALALSELIG